MSVFLYKIKQLPCLFNVFNTYLRTVFVVFSGSSLSMLIPILFIPILTRLYSPIDFGQYGFVYSVGVLLGVFSTLRYENSIVIAKSDREAAQIQRLCELLIISINFLSIIILACLYFGFKKFHLESWWHEWYISIPFVSFSTALFKVKTLLANRLNHFKYTAKVKVTQGVLITFLGILFGAIDLSANGMVWAFIIGNMITVLLLHQKNKDTHAIHIHDLLTVAKRYTNFPFFSLPAELVSNVVTRYPLIFFPFFFGSEITGFLTLAYRVVAIPARFVSTAVAEVFFQKASKEVREKGQCHNIFFFTSAFLFTISIVGFSILFLLSDFIFSVFLDPIWFKTSAYIKILIPLFMVNFIVSPLSTMIYISEKQSWDLYFQFTFLFMLIVSTLTSWLIYKEFEIVLFSMVITGCCLYFIYYLLFFILIKEKLPYNIPKERECS